ncbi:MAG: DNA-3-methyladenine glycosylase 2 family protein [Chloroflexi bacterium]|nr:DNA-3-methyladenine glycosylase 2 family protein [Chloroflexota bacterium]
MLQYDPIEAVDHLRKADSALRGVIDQAGPLEIESRGGAFKSLGRAIFFQQLAGPAARAIMGRVLDVLATDEERWYEPHHYLAASDDDLRAAGLSRQKLTYLRDLAEKFAEGTLREEEFAELDDEQVIERASQVKGIGRWTCEMFLMFSLGRADVLPVGDLGVRRGMEITYGLNDLPKPEEMQRIAEPWRPYRTAGSWYMWRALGVEVPEQGRGFKKDGK